MTARAAARAVVLLACLLLGSGAGAGAAFAQDDPPDERAQYAEFRRLRDQGMQAFRELDRSRSAGDAGRSAVAWREAHANLTRALDRLEAILGPLRLPDGTLPPEYEGYEEELSELAHYLFDLEKHGPPVVAPAPAPAGARNVDLALGPALLERLAPLRERHRLPALGALVIVRGEVAGIAVVGSRRLGSPEGVTVDDPWHLGSCTKAMTATLAARLVEREALRWDSGLGEVFAGQAEAMDPAWRTVTLEQLLAHRAGAPADLTRDALWMELFFDTETPLPALRQKVLATVTARAPHPAPGERFVYSNAGYVLAGAACEQVGGRPYEDLLRAELFEPLGMRGAGFGPPGSADAIDAPRGHRRDGRRLAAIDPGVMADNPASIAPAGTVHAPLRAWAAFARLHLRGARGEEGLLLEPETFRALHAARGDDGYALGWGAGERDWAGGRVLTHSGSNTMWFCTVVLAPDANAAALAVTNCGGDEAERACAATVKALLALAREQPEPGAPGTPGKVEPR